MTAQQEGATVLERAPDVEMPEVARPSRKKKRRRTLPFAQRHTGASWAQVWGIRFLGVALIAAIWEIAVRVELVDRLILPTPSAVFSELRFLMTQGAMWNDISVTLQEVGWGLLAAIAIGVPVGLLAGLLKRFWIGTEPLVMALYSIPSVAFLPLFIIWFGTGLLQKSILVFVGAVFPIIISTQSGAATVDRRLVETVQTFLAGRMAVITKVIIPGSIPSIISGIRIGLGRALIMAVVAEFYAATAGLGYRIFRAGAAFRTAELFATVIVLAVIGVLLSALLTFANKRLSPWLNT